jgi:hypothetical protein
VANTKDSKLDERDQCEAPWWILKREEEEEEVVAVTCNVFLASGAQ